MAYPFLQLPSFFELIGRLTSPEFSCTFETVDSPMELDGDADQCISIHFLKREGKTYALYIEDFSEIVAPSLLRSICDRLEIAPASFGLTLG